MKVIAHKTTSGVYPPNSIHSLLFLVRHGISAVEFDVCRARDGRLVVAHPGLMKTKMLRTASGFLDFLEVCNSASVDVFVDVKFTDWRFDEAFLDSIMNTIFDVDMYERSVIISRSEKVLSRFRDNIATGFIISDTKSELLHNYDMLLVPIQKLSDDIVALHRWEGKLVATKVDISNVKLAQESNLYAIMTNYAIEVQESIGERRV